VQDSASAGIPLRQFGRAEAKFSILGFGGHHLGDAPDEKTAVRIVQQDKLGEIKIGGEDSMLSTRGSIYSIQRFIVSGEEIIPIFVGSDVDIAILDIVFELASFGRHQVCDRLPSKRCSVVRFIA